MSEENQGGPYQLIAVSSPFLSTYYVITPCPQIDKITFLHKGTSNTELV